jgi:hypothetical protein
MSSISTHATPRPETVSTTDVVEVSRVQNGDDKLAQPSASRASSAQQSVAQELRVFLGAHWESQAVKELYEELKADRVTPDNIPATFLESQRIVNPLSPEGVTFQNSMEQLTKRLLPEIDQKAHPITFVIADAQQENAFIITTPQQSLICFDRKLLATFDNLDQLSWVLLHELTHLQYKDLFGAVPASQTEEAACDLRPLMKMHDAGLNPAEAEAYAIKMAKTKQPAWLSMVDAHGLPPFRVDAIQKGLAALRHSRGKLKEGTEPLPDPLQVDGGLRGARHESFVDLKLKATQYAEGTTLEKVRILHSMLPDLEARFHHRADDMAKRVRKLIVAESDKETRVVLAQLMDSLLDNPPAFNALHVHLRSALDGAHPKKIRYYAPRLLQVAKAAKAFIEADDDTTAQEKAAAASHLIKTLEDLPAWQSINWGTVDLPHFALPDEREYKRAIKEAKSSGDDVVFPWHELAEAASSENQIGRALLCLGTWDDRIPLNAGNEDLTWMDAHLRLAKQSSGHSHHSYESTISTPRTDEGENSRFQLITNGGGLIKKVDPLATDRDTVKRDVANRITVELERARLEAETSVAIATVPSEELPSSSRERTLSFLSLPYSEFMKDPYAHLRVNEVLLCPPSYISPSGSAGRLRSQLRDLMALTTNSARSLLRYFDGMLDVTSEPERTTYREFVRDFFLNETTPFNFQTVVERQFEDNSYSNIFQYVRWAGNDTHQLFSLQEKGLIFSEYHEGGALTLGRNAAGMRKPETVDELRHALDTYLEMTGLHDHTENSKVDLSLFTSEVISAEVAEFLRDHRDAEGLHRLLSSHGHWLRDVYREASFDQIFVEYFKHEKSWPTDAMTLGAIYRAIEGLGIFPNELWRASFAVRVLESVDATTDLQTRVDALENLLLGTPPKDVDIREGAIARWVTSMATMYGDDHTASWNSSDCPYLATIQPVLDRVAGEAHSSIRGEMLDALGNRILAQRQVSHAIERAILGPIDNAATQSTGAAYGGLQAGFMIIGEAKENRFKTIHFLTRPLTDKRIKAFSKLVINEGMATSQMLDADDLSGIDSPRNRRRIQLECKRIHENFWRAPIGYRAAFLEELMMPAAARLRDLQAGTQKTFTNACDFVISELLPLKDRHDRPIKYAPEAQRILRAFLADGVLDHRQQPIFLSALMAAAQRSNEERGRLSVGQILASIFDNMGPAWRKFGQAIANHPSTPLDIARDMEPLKGKQSVTRAQAWALYEHTVPEDIRIQNPRLGPVLESASFFTAVDAGNEVFTFLTPKALVRAEDGFSIMESFVAELRKAEDSLSQVAPAVAEMVSSARTSAILETNGRVGAAQADAMRARYNELTVTIGNMKFPFSTAAWSDHGPEFRRMQKMKGPTFNDVPSTTPEEIEHKRHVAKTIVYVELRNILSGNAFCVDRHGRNIRVDGNSVGHFDHGAVHAVVRDKKGKEVHPLEAEPALVGGGTVEIPGASGTEKLQLAEALYSAYTQLNGGQPLAVVMHNEIEKARAATGATPEYLIRVERALLALNDCFKCLNGQDMKDILGSLYLNGDIDKTITTTLESKIKSEKIGGFAGLFVNASKVIRGEIEKSVVERMTVSQGSQNQGARSQWHDNAMNRQDVPSLLTTRDFRQKKKEESGRARKRSLTVPTLE